MLASSAALACRSVRWNTVTDRSFTAKDTAEQYMPHSTEYSEASPGVGAVLSALAEMLQLQRELIQLSDKVNVNI